MKDFYFHGDDYRYHIDFEAKHRFLELLKERFNSGVKYKGKSWKWDTVILKKTEELGRFLLDKTEFIDFSNSNMYNDILDSSYIQHNVGFIGKRAR
ncbi:MAG: hypothetical protein NWE90_01130 [Candidatus Bathyarchaeota archaeon]|nr:hypothetical protein [Candidatus Bathyarchaeota archaeon]